MGLLFFQQKSHWRIPNDFLLLIVLHLLQIKTGHVVKVTT
jgi:hypothetical protein